MRFPDNFTKAQKITFYTQRNKEMVKQLKKHPNHLKIQANILECTTELNKLNNN